jgi:hypothetical protein
MCYSNSVPLRRAARRDEDEMAKIKMTGSPWDAIREITPEMLDGAIEVIRAAGDEVAEAKARHSHCPCGHLWPAHDEDGCQALLCQCAIVSREDLA